jgi:hypothetical protein
LYGENAVVSNRNRKARLMVQIANGQPSPMTDAPVHLFVLLAEDTGKGGSFRRTVSGRQQKPARVGLVDWHQIRRTHAAVICGHPARCRLLELPQPVLRPAERGKMMKPTPFATTLLGAMAFGFAASAQGLLDVNAPLIGKEAGTFTIRARATG